jgi:tetratricopeptide (TPR) repeat protein
MSNDSSKIYDELMSRKDFTDLSPDEFVERIARLIDVSGDLGRDEGIGRGLELCDAAEKQNLSAPQAALIEYFRANAWGIRQSWKHRDPDTVWRWEQPEVQNQVWHLRRAVSHSGFGSITDIQRCQILTNLGGHLSHVGRSFEAIECWGRAIAIIPRFAMALGNRGYGLEQAARSLYDPGHRYVYLWFAHEDLSAALSSKVVWDSPHYDKAKHFFSNLKSEIEANVDVAEVKRRTNLTKHSLGRTRAERCYRQWCLENRLFLNPLNDLGPFPIAGRDVLSQPNLVSPLAEPPALIGFFSQMKQEFVSARWLFYDALHNIGVHFSDRDVRLYDTLDYPSFGLAVEKTKAAYRMAYSLFDKIAFFLNEYLCLGINPKDVSLRTIWYKNVGTKSRVLREQFVEAENWPLRGLYWLAKDLFDAQFRDVLEPDAYALNEIRNRAEHRFLKVHETVIPQTEAAAAHSASNESLAYSVGRREFEQKTIRLFKLVRAGFLYMSLAMHREEMIRNARRDKGKTMPMNLILYDDDRKM